MNLTTHISKSDKLKDSLPTSHFLQPKLTINEPDDQYEQEADQMANPVMRMPANDRPFFKPCPLSISRVQRKCKECEDEEKLQRKESLSQPAEKSSEVSSYIDSLSSKGSPLPESLRSFFEPRFGQNFSNVKIHSDADAAKSSQSVNALAYTVGNNIVFNLNQFSPETDNGKKLLAHELMHVVQQQNNSAGIQKKPSPTTTPTPKGGVAQKQGGFELQIDYIKITGLPDVYKSAREQPHEAHTYLSKPKISIDDPSYKLDPKTKLVMSFVAYKPLQISLTIETNYASDVIPKGPSDYGYGTRAEDAKKKTTSIEFHEGSHGSLFVGYIQKEIAKHPLPQFEGKVGMTESDFLQKDKEYLQKVGEINQMILDAINYATVTVDCAGTSIDTHNAGRKGYVNICP